MTTSVQRNQRGQRACSALQAASDQPSDDPKSTQAYITVSLYIRSTMSVCCVVVRPTPGCMSVWHGKTGSEPDVHSTAVARALLEM